MLLTGFPHCLSNVCSLPLVASGSSCLEDMQLACSIISTQNVNRLARCTIQLVFISPPACRVLQISCCVHLEQVNGPASHLMWVSQPCI